MEGNNSAVHIVLIDVEGVRQGYFLSRDRQAVEETRNVMMRAAALVESGKSCKLYDVQEIPGDANPLKYAGIMAAEYLKGNDVIYVPLNVTSVGMVSRLLPKMGDTATTEMYVKAFYPKLVMNRLLEAAIICDLCLYKPRV